MDDIISRQAAIDEFYMATCDVDKVEWAETVLKRVPSAEQDWIPCSERLPEDGTWNLFTDGGNISVERYKADAIDSFFPSGRWFDFDDAVAWMSLPKPYCGARMDGEQ